jgi:hypothetical protein
VWQPKAWYDPSIPVHAIDETTEVHECFNDVCCELSADKSSVSCATDLGYYGPLCGGCNMDRGFLRNGYVCTKCDTIVNNYLALSGLTVGIIVVVIYIAAFRNTNQRVGEYGGIIRRIAFSYMQV